MGCSACQATEWTHYTSDLWDRSFLLRPPHTEKGSKPRMSLLPTGARSFTSFPDTPAFDSFPAQVDKKRARKRSRSRTERRDNEERTHGEAKRKRKPHDTRDGITTSRSGQLAEAIAQPKPSCSDSDESRDSRRRSRRQSRERGDESPKSTARHVRSDATSKTEVSERKSRHEGESDGRRRPKDSSSKVRTVGPIDEA